MTTNLAHDVSSLHIQQWLGLPLMYIDVGLYNSWQSHVKGCTTVLLLGLNQWRAPVMAQISSDSSVKGQICKSRDGEVILDFPQRVVLMANHQVCARDHRFSCIMTL